MRIVFGNFAFGLVLLLSTSVGANAQTTAAPAGSLSATAPGGTVGRAGPRNRASALRSGNAYVVSRGGRSRAVRAR